MVFSIRRYAMKTATMVVLLLALSMPAVAVESPATAQQRDQANITDLQSHLNSFAALAEDHVANVMNSLKLIAITQEAQSGKWENIKPLLEELNKSGIQAAAVWFVRPDGSYYTTEKDLTGSNLRDRAYFPKLMNGEEVPGSLVISKSTGERSAVVAAPIKKNGAIIGGLGASLDVKEVSAMINAKMGLPQDMVFYALNEKGQAALHRKAELLFAYPSDMGSPSLKEKTREMLSKRDGVVNYDFQGKRTVVFKKYPVTGWTFALGRVAGAGQLGTGAGGTGPGD
jgi:methyl-accepting chemotaxis protein